MQIVSDDHLQEAVDIIRSGGIVAHATETCYGFACDLTNPDAVQKLYALKNLPASRSVSALFPSVAEAKKFVEWNETAEEIAQKHLPGPLMLVLKVKRSRLKDIHVQVDYLGIRISSHPIAQALAEQCGIPISSTSANLHDSPSTYSAEEIQIQFKDQILQPDLILDSGALPQNPPSTVVRIEAGVVTILRQGNIKVE